MKKVLSIFFIFILFLIFINWYNSRPEVIISRVVKNKDIRAGQLRYKIYLMKVIPVGEASLGVAKVEDYKGAKVYHLTGSAHSSSLFTNFFQARAYLDSYVDIQELSPMLFRQKLVIKGKRQFYREVFYDQANGTMSLEGVRRQIYPNTQDPLSAMFNVRLIDFKKTDKIEIGLNTNQKNYILKGTVRNQSVTVGKDIYKTAFLDAHISRRDKNPYHKSNISMVLLEEVANVPILINVFAGGVLINARLIDINDRNN
ncbi:MAG: DUF3108 domain-containing protein [Candidatus Omnitrophica bacterium]|nr:DUF3108 domain-containing protein [Candidatus Omnitrophota bacterium]MDD5591958.1 DUF3108 domain-containing protein [Candidatus Omnitrophota bacterium]